MSTSPLVFGHEPGSATPAATFENSRTLEPSRPLLDFLRSLAERLEAEDRERVIRLHRRGVRMQKMYEGDYGDFHPTSGAWMSRPGYAMGTVNKKTGKSSPWYPHNKIRRYCDAVTAQTFQSRIDLRAIATRDDDRSELAALAARSLVDYHEQSIFTEEFITDEDKQKRFFGQVFFYGYWDLNAGPLVDELGVTQTDYHPGGSVFTCLRCGESGDEQDVSQAGGCPGCGSQALSEDQIPPMTLPTFGVIGKKRAGDFKIDVVPSLQVNYDRTAPRFELGLWCERQRRMRVEILQKFFPQWKVPQSNESTGTYDRSGADLLESGTGNTGGGGSGRWKSSSAKRTLIRQFWFQPEMYGDEVLPQDVPMMSGESIPANTSLAEMYPNGMYVLFGGKDILDIWEDDFTKHWVQLKDKHIPNRTDGDGAEDIIRPAQEYNESRSFAVGAWKHNAARPQWTRDPIKEGDFTGQPGYIGHVKGLDYKIPLSNLHHVADAVPLDGSVMAMMSTADGEMQQCLAATGTMIGDPSSDVTGGAETKGGMELINSNAQTQRLPEFALRAYAYKRLHLIGIQLFRQNATEERWIPINAEAGELAGKYLKGADLDGDIDLSFGKGSYAPKDDARRRANLMWVFGIQGAQGPLVLDPSAPAKWRQYILDTGGVDMQLDDFTLDAQNARRRIEDMKRLAPQAQQMAGVVAQMAQQIAPDLVGAQGPGMQPPQPGMPPAPTAPMQPQGPPPEQGMEPQAPPMPGQPAVAPPAPPNAAELLCQMVPIDPQVDKHEVHYAFYINWLKGDEARRVDPVVNQAVHLRLSEHEQAGAAEAGRKQMLALQAQGPMMALQQSQQNDQAQKESGQRADDRTHDLEKQDKQMAHEKEVANIKTQNTKAAANS